MKDPIVELLLGKRLRQKIAKAVNDTRQWADIVRHVDPEEHPELVAEVGSTPGGAWEYALGEHEGDFEEALQKHVLEKLALPHRIAPEDIVEPMINFFGPGPAEDAIDLDDAYLAFVQMIANDGLIYRRPGPFPIARVKKLRGEADEQSCDEGAWLLWRGKHLAVQVFGRGYWSGPGQGEVTGGGDATYMLAIVAGAITARALCRLRADLERALPSVIRSVGLLKSEEGTHRAFDERHFMRGLPKAEEAVLRGSLYLVKQCLDAYYANPTKKDSIDRRIRNAVHLLVESDMQANDAVGLSLSVATIEALLGKKTEGIADKLADSVAALLEPFASAEG